MGPRAIALLAVGCLSIAGCANTELPTASGATTTVAPPASPSIPRETAAAQPIAGGCGSTQVFAGPAPGATDQSLHGNPWASASPPDSGITAYFWRQAPYLAAGHINPDGGANKILWIAHNDSSGDLAISAHPLSAPSPVVRFDVPGGGSYPSLVDLPSPGCWHLDLTIGPARATMDLIVGPPPSS
jgi:hypothetical protein